MRVKPGEPAFSMPVRLEIATRIAAGLCVTTPANYETGPCNAAIVERALVLADALIAAHNGESQ